MHIIGHSVDNEQFVFVSVNDSSHLAIQVVLPGRGNDRHSMFNGKDQMQMNLSVGVGHVSWWD